MKQFTLTVLLLMVLLGDVISRKKSEINLSDAMQVDSSTYFIIPRLVDSYDRSVYGNGKGYMPWNNYSDIYFYNTSTSETKRLFGGTLALIVPFATDRYSKEPESQYPKNILNKHIIYLARTENFNRDNAIDSHDPVYLFVSDKTGNNLKQLTPGGMHVVSWTASHDKKILLVKLLVDKNGNKKFGEGDDDIFYRIDLDDNISNIKSTRVDL